MDAIRSREPLPLAGGAAQRAGAGSSADVKLPASSGSAGALLPQAGGDLKTRQRIEKTAKDFEAAFIGQMLGQMFQGVETSAPFGGGPGEAAFKSFLTEAMAKQMSAAGGLGMADDLARQMLKLQGLE